MEFRPFACLRGPLPCGPHPYLQLSSQEALPKSPTLGIPPLWLPWTYPRPSIPILWPLLPGEVPSPCSSLTKSHSSFKLLWNSRLLWVLPLEFLSIFCFYYLFGFWHILLSIVAWLLSYRGGTGSWLFCDFPLNTHTPPHIAQGWEHWERSIKKHFWPDWMAWRTVPFNNYGPINYPDIASWRERPHQGPHRWETSLSAKTQMQGSLGPLWLSTWLWV